MKARDIVKRLDDLQRKISVFDESRWRYNWHTFPQYNSWKSNIKLNPVFNSTLNKVYLLIDPVTEGVFYVGLTNQPVIKRLMQHLVSNDGPDRKNKKFLELYNKRVLPKVDVVYSTPNRHVAERVESILIKYPNMIGFNHELVNKKGKKPQKN